MSALDWVLTAVLFSIYLMCLFTVCSLTFRKGYILLGIFGIFVPWLWLIGAILPARRGSSYERYEQMHQMQLREQVNPVAQTS